MGSKYSFHIPVPRVGQVQLEDYVLLSLHKMTFELTTH